MYSSSLANSKRLHNAIPCDIKYLLKYIKASESPTLAG